MTAFVFPSLLVLIHDYFVFIQRVLDVMFTSPLKEVEEEINIPVDHLQAPLLVGIAQDKRLKPDLLFVTTTTLSFSEVQERYSKGALDAFESTQLIGIHKDTIIDGSIPGDMELVPPSAHLVRWYYDHRMLSSSES